MIINTQILKAAEACGAGYDWFKEKYGDADVDMIDVIKDCPKDEFLHWSRLHLMIDEDVLSAYREKVSVKNSEDVVGSSHVYDSSNVLNSERVYNSENVENSKVIKHSTDVSDSQNVTNSNTVSGCRNIDDSMCVFNSKFINKCNNIKDCAMLEKSNDCWKSRMLISCDKIQFSETLNNCKMINNCKKLTNCMFCYDIEDKEYYIFNEPVLPYAYEMLNHGYMDIIYPKMAKISENLEVNATTIYDDIISDKDCMEFIKSLPGYNDDLFFNITKSLKFLKENK